MSSPDRSPARVAVGPMVLIALVVGAAAAAFAYTAGWFSPERLTPSKVVDAFAPSGGAALGHRRNHVKGICFTGRFEANGEGVTLSDAPMFHAGQYSAIGRFNLATADINAADATVRIRGMGLQIAAPGGQLWRMAMIDRATACTRCCGMPISLWHSFFRARADASRGGALSCAGAARRRVRGDGSRARSKSARSRASQWQPQGAGTRALCDRYRRALQTDLLQRDGGIVGDRQRRGQRTGGGRLEFHR